MQEREDQFKKKGPIDNFAINSCLDCNDYCIVKGECNPIAITPNNTIYSVIRDPHNRQVCLGKEVKGAFELYPNSTKERECLYISGPSGSGKTYFANEYLKKYKKIFPHKQIVLFSQKPIEEETVDHNHVQICDSLFGTIDLKNYADSLVIFDDVENISQSRDLTEKTLNLLNEMLNIGRSLNISVIVISHILMNYRFTKNIISECTKVVMFPKSGSKYQYMNFLTKHIGYTKSQIRKLLSTKSRWLVLDKECPNTILTSTHLRILD